MKQNYGHMIWTIIEGCGILQKIPLSVADDLDAFGYLGIYRYIEIYLARGVQPDKIGPMARANAEKRYNNFKSNFADYPELVKKHQKRYQLLDKFFEELSNESVRSPEFRVRRFI